MRSRAAAVVGAVVTMAGLAGCSSSGKSLSTPTLPTISASASAAAVGGPAPGLSTYVPPVYSAAQPAPTVLARFVIPASGLGTGYVSTTASNPTAVAGHPVATICGNALGTTGMTTRYAVTFAPADGGSAVVQQALYRYSAGGAAAAVRAITAAKSCVVKSAANAKLTVTTTLSHPTVPGLLPGTLVLRRATATSGTKGTTSIPPLVSLTAFQVAGDVLSTVEVSGGSATEQLALFKRAATLAGGSLHAK